MYDMEIVKMDDSFVAVGKNTYLYMANKPSCPSLIFLFSKQSRLLDIDVRHDDTNDQDLII